MTKLIHSMIRVRDLAKARGFYADAFGMVESHRLEFPTFALVYLRDPESNSEIELTWNKGQETPYTHGSGYGHVAFCVEDLDAFRGDLSGKGLGPGDIKTLEVEGTPVARFFFISDPDGYRIEVLEKAGHYV